MREIQFQILVVSMTLQYGWCDLIMKHPSKAILVLGKHPFSEPAAH